MTKLICPIRTCTIDVPANTHQHINQHLLMEHNVQVTPETRDDWRRKQDKLWRSRFRKAEQKLDDASAEHRARMREKAEKGQLPVDVDGEGRDLEQAQVAYAELEDVGSDGEEEASELRAGVAVVEGHEDEVMPDHGPEYSQSMRHYQLAEGRAKAWTAREEVNERLAEAVAKNGPNGMKLDRSVGEAEAAAVAAEKEAREELAKERKRARLAVDDPASRINVL